MQSAKAWRGIAPPEEWRQLALASEAGRIAGPTEVNAVLHLVWRGFAR